MAFDHGQRRIAPLNLLMIVGNLAVWWRAVSPWLLIPLAIVALVFTGDHYVGMFVAFLLLLVFLVIGVSVR